MKPLLNKSFNFASLGPSSSFLTLVLVSTLLTSCSWVTSRRSLFGDNPKVEKESSTAPSKKGKVSREEYEKLKAKYEALAQGRVAPNASHAEQAQSVPDQMQDPSQLVDKLQSASALNESSNTELAETVDVFGKNGISRPNTTAKTSTLGIEDHERDFVSDSIESEIMKLREAEALIAQNKLSEGLTQIKKVENSTSRQIRVRAKFFLGEILFKQKEYDLAMQVFEEIISKDAFSGVVLKTLGRLIICCEKLKQEKKQQQYYSILHDFFESET